MSRTHSFIQFQYRTATTKKAQWQTEPFTEKVLRQLHEQPRVVIERESVIRHTHTDHSVPDITDIASYVECASVSSQDFHASPSPPHDGDNIEDELTRMFHGEHDKVTDTKETSKGKDSPCAVRKHKRKETLQDLLVELFGSPLDDLSESTPAKKIRTQRRHTLPISLTLDAGILIPLHIEDKRRSEAGTATCQNEERAVATSVTREVEENYTRVAELVVPPVYAETTRVSYSDYELETTFTMEKPCMGYSETVKAATEVATIIDLTAEEDSTMTDFKGIPTRVKGDFIKSESKACAASMPLLSPVSPAEPTKTEEVFLKKQKQPDLEIFPIGHASLGNQINEAGARDSTQQSLSLAKGAVPPLNVPGVVSSVGNIQPNTYAQNAYGGNQQQNISAPRGPYVGNPQRNLSGAMTGNQQQNICGSSRFVSTTQQNHNVAQVSPLKDNVQGQKRTNVENGTSEVPPRRRRSTNKPRTNATAPAPECFNVPLKGGGAATIQQQQTLNGGGTVTIQQQQNSPQPQDPDVARVNHSILDDLVNWEAARKRTMLQKQANQAGPAFAPGRLNFRIPEQWQWSAVNNQQTVPRANPEPNQLPPRLLRLLNAPPPPEYTLISNSACAEKLYPHVNKFMQWRTDAFHFYEKTKTYLTLIDLKEQSTKFSAYSHQFRLALGRGMIRELSGIDVRSFNMHQILTYLSVRVVVNSCSVTVTRICSNIFTLLSPVEEECNTPFLRKLFSNVKACIRKMEEKYKQALFTTAQLQVLEKQIRQYTLIQNWINVKIGSAQLRVRIPQQKKTPRTYPAQNKTPRWQQRTVFDTPPQPQEAVPRLQHENPVPRSVSAQEASEGTLERAVPVGNPAPARSASENVAMQKASANAQRNTVESGTSKSTRTESRVTFESVARRAPTAQEDTVVRYPANVDVPESPQVAVEESVQESRPSNKEQIEVVKETGKGQDKVQEVIDLTWIEDGDQEEILEEIIECKCFPFKVENHEESEAGAAAREVVSPTDSGLGSPVAQSDGDGFKCLCGNRAIYVCACNSSMYCGSDCQVRDWMYHQKLCYKMKP